MTATSPKRHYCGRARQSPRREGAQLNALQGGAGVAALPLHQGLTQAAGGMVGLTAPALADVLCVVSIGERMRAVGRGGRERSVSQRGAWCGRAGLGDWPPNCIRLVLPSQPAAPGGSIPRPSNQGHSPQGPPQRVVLPPSQGRKWGGLEALHWPSRCGCRWPGAVALLLRAWRVGLNVTPKDYPPGGGDTAAP